MTMTLTRSCKAAEKEVERLRLAMRLEAGPNRASAVPDYKVMAEAADALERLKVERDWQDKCAELQARQITEQTDEIERLKAELHRRTALDEVSAETWAADVKRLKAERDEWKWKTELLDSNLNLAIARAEAAEREVIRLKAMIDGAFT